jgi:hypothetical protein
LLPLLTHPYLVLRALRRQQLRRARVPLQRGGMQCAAQLLALNHQLREPLVARAHVGLPPEKIGSKT